MGWPSPSPFWAMRKHLSMMVRGANGARLMRLSKPDRSHRFFGLSQEYVITGHYLSVESLPHSRGSNKRQVSGHQLVYRQSAH